MDEKSLVRYEEWQKISGEETGRRSMALLREDPTAPAEIQWVYPHETWIEDG